MKTLHSKNSIANIALVKGVKGMKGFLPIAKKRYITQCEMAGQVHQGFGKTHHSFHFPQTLWKSHGFIPVKGWKT